MEDKEAKKKSIKASTMKILVSDFLDNNFLEVYHITNCFLVKVAGGPFLGLENYIETIHSKKTMTQPWPVTSEYC